MNNYDRLDLFVAAALQGLLANTRNLSHFEAAAEAADIGGKTLAAIDWWHAQRLGRTIDPKTERSAE